MLFLNRVVARTADRLLGAIDDQGLGFLLREFRFALDAEPRLRVRLDPLDRPANRTFMDFVEEAEELLGDVAAVVDQLTRR